MTEADDTDLGATGRLLHVWRSKEAVRQGEARIAAQAQGMVAMEARASSVLGWAVALGTALAAVLPNPDYRWAAVGGLAAAVTAAVCCVRALWPNAWGEPGLLLTQMEQADLKSEYAYADAYAQGLERTIEKNRARANRFARLLKRAWLAMCAIPVLAATGAVASAVAARL